MNNTIALAQHKYTRLKVMHLSPDSTYMTLGAFPFKEILLFDVTMDIKHQLIMADLEKFLNLISSWIENHEEIQDSRI